MPKGNHVFNQFDKVLGNALDTVVDRLLRSDEFKGVPTSQVMAAKLPRALTAYQRICAHDQMRQIHELQDDQEVAKDDPNSVAFGHIAESFQRAVWAWAIGDDAAQPMEEWRKLVNVGMDSAARANYVARGTRGAEAREAECVEAEKFIKGGLTRAIAVCVYNLRWDLKQAGSVGYGSKREEWGKLLGLQQ